jgi:hypothetical protein
MGHYLERLINLQKSATHATDKTANTPLLSVLAVPTAAHSEIFASETVAQPESVTDLMSFLGVLCEGMTFTPTDLLERYLTLNDLADIRAGIYEGKIDALQRLIASYPPDGINRIPALKSFVKVDELTHI